MAIETSSRAGGAALGRGAELLAAAGFDASQRQATQLLRRMDELLRAHGVRPGELDELYVSVGPGSFTGVRLGVTVARTMAQAVEGLRLVAVPAAWVLAENVRDLDWPHLAVMLEARDQTVYAALFARQGPDIVAAGPPGLVRPEAFLAAAPRPLLLVGEALEHLTIPAADVRRAEPALNLPTAQALWRVGRRLAAAGQFTPPAECLPIYSRRPQAERMAGQTQL